VVVAAAWVFSRIAVESRSNMSYVEERRPGALEGLPEPFRIEVRPDRGRVHVVAHGEVDMVTVPQLAAEIDDLVGRGFEAVVLDLRATSFLDSSGVHMLVEQAARTDARITVIEGSPQVRRILDITGVRRLLQFEATV
jgi:anti-sigma B factor antagonist